MFRKLYYAVAGDPNEKELDKLRPMIGQINALEPKFEAMSNDDLRTLTAEFQARIHAATDDLRAALQAAEEEFLAVLGTDEQRFARIEVERLKKELLKAEEAELNAVLPEAFAAVREAAKRTIGLRHFDVQLIGGMVLHEGRIAEMKTGEGKTLVATLPIYLNALSGQGVHLVTPNDYLSKYGLQAWDPSISIWVSVQRLSRTPPGPDKGPSCFDPIFGSDDARYQNLRPITRREAYHADITYGTNNEFGFDYLRDNMAWEKARLAQRELHFAIVDEVDNILIDEARTPLIISGQADEPSNYYAKFTRLCAA